MEKYFEGPMLRHRGAGSSGPGLGSRLSGGILPGELLSEFHCPQLEKGDRLLGS